jgi:hypothetical protein
MMLTESLFQSQPYLSVVVFHVKRNISIKKLQKSIQIMIELAVAQVQYECQWNNFKDILFGVFTILSQIRK